MTQDFQNTNELYEGSEVMDVMDANQLGGPMGAIGGAARGAAGAVMKVAKAGALGKEGKIIADIAGAAMAGGAAQAAAETVHQMFQGRDGGGGSSGGGPGGFENTGGEYAYESGGGKHHINDRFEDVAKLKFETNLPLPTMFANGSYGYEGEVAVALNLVVPNVIPSSGTVFNHFVHFIKDDITSYIAANVKYSLNYDTEFNASNLRSYFVSLFNVMCFVFSYESVIAYTDSGVNLNNVGMDILRSRVGPSDYNIYQLARQRLMTFAIPPNLMSFAYFLSQNYLLSPFEGATVCKLDFWGGWGSNLNGNPARFLEAELNSLNLKRNLIDKMYNAIPSWQPQSIPQCAAKPIYDETFMHLWINLPGSFITTASNYVRTPETVNGQWNYYALNENVDGLVYALGTAWNPTSAAWTTNVLIPFESTETETSRVCFNANGVLKPTYSSLTQRSFGNANIAYLDNSVTPNVAKAYQAIPNGLRRTAFCNVETRFTTLLSYAEWLFTIGSSPKGVERGKFRRGKKGKKS